MSQRTEAVLAFVPSALIASQVGTWESDLTSDRTVADAKTASLFGVDPDAATLGLPLVSYTQNIHPDDRAKFERKLGGIRDHGGLFVIEYRTCPTPLDFRWVLVRGRYERDPRTGHVIGRGIVIDITDSKGDGRVEDRAFFVRHAPGEASLEQVAHLALEVRNEIDELGEKEDSPMRKAVDALLWVVGRSLVQRRDDAKSGKLTLN
jgi:hypothetical protein